MARRLLLVVLSVLLAVALPAAADDAGGSSDPPSTPASDPSSGSSSASPTDPDAQAQCELVLVCLSDPSASPLVETLTIWLGESGNGVCRYAALDPSAPAAPLTLDPDGCLRTFVHHTVGWSSITATTSLPQPLGL